MLSRQFVRENPEVVREALDNKGVDVDLDRILDVDEEWRELKSRGDDLRHERNEVSSTIGELKQAGEEEAAQEAIERSQEVKSELQEIEERADELEAELEESLLELPRSPRVGAGRGRRVGERRATPRGVRRPARGSRQRGAPLRSGRGAGDPRLRARREKVAGGGFYVAKGDGARLEHALIQFMLDVHREQDYRDVFPPIAVNSTSMRGTGQLPKFTEDAYRIEGTNEDAYDDDDLWLLPTAEVPVTNLHRDEILLGEDLPLKYQAYTPNFRQEAGEHGTETRGIVRVHQFNKVEMVNFVRPEESHERFEGLVDEAEEVLRRLELPYRILEMCTGDLGFTQAKKYDLEVWAPADDMDEGPAEGGRWLEVSSVSNFEEFQARRAGIRYREEHHESAEFLHTLNGSGLAVPRIVVAILEYYQNDDGTVTVPEALRPYMGGTEVIEGHDAVGETKLGGE